MVPAIVLILITGTGCFADISQNVRIVSEVAKGHAGFIDKMKQVGHYGIKYDECYAEIDDQEISCPDLYLLRAVKVQVEDNSGHVHIVIPETVVGTVYNTKVPTNNNWRITIARYDDACRPGASDSQQLPDLPAMVTLYTACFPLVDKRGNQINKSKELETKINFALSQKDMHSFKV